MTGYTIPSQLIVFFAVRPERSRLSSRPRTSCVPCVDVTQDSGKRHAGGGRLDAACCDKEVIAYHDLRMSVCTVSVNDQFPFRVIF